MSLGFDRQTKIVALGDSVKLTAFIRDSRDQLYTYEDLAAVSFVIQGPDGVKLNNDTPYDGEVLEDGSGYLVLDTDNTFTPGHYIGVASFELVDGTTQSTSVNFELFDPFKMTDSATSIVADGVWMKLEDCFDAENEGPWLQDVTMNFFREEKMEEFIQAALFDINYQNPPTSLKLDTFVTTNTSVTPNTYTVTDNYPLLVQGVLIQVLRHVMRSYVEQPMPTGVNIAWQDRRDYLQRWKEVFDIEKMQYDRWVALYKRGFLQLGHAKVLVAAKAGRLVPAPMRARAAGRGYW
jgi:hypothetical protein